MNFSSLRGYLLNGAAFLAVYFGFQILGASVWHFVASSVQHWWRGHGVAGLIGGLVGMVVFVAFGEYRRREKMARSVLGPAAVKRQPTGPWA